ncbi:MAG: glutamine synthetase beta-grasp domain-containing protein, partial [Kofleriaceae bacterium]
MTPSELNEYVKKHGAKMIDAKFVDFLGQWKHLTYPIERLNEGIEEGFGFDGSSIAGWKAINSSDMLMKPDPSTAVMDPFLKTPTLSLLCDVIDPITHEPYSRDPRSLAKRAQNYLKSTGIADTAYYGPEAEFFVFDGIKYSEDPNHSFFHVDSDEGGWNNRRDENGRNLGSKTATKGGYCTVGPMDQLSDLRTNMVSLMQAVGIIIETHHHEVASAGQCEIDMKYDTMLKMADQVLWYKHIVKNVARAAGKTATFMPKPLFGDNGSGMHTHQSLWKSNKPLFAGDAYAGMSEMALFYIGGLLKH